MLQKTVITQLKTNDFYYKPCSHLPSNKAIFINTTFDPLTLFVGVGVNNAFKISDVKKVISFMLTIALSSDVLHTYGTVCSSHSFYGTYSVQPPLPVLDSYRGQSSCSLKPHWTFI